MSFLGSIGDFFSDVGSGIVDINKKFFDPGGLFTGGGSDVPPLDKIPPPPPPPDMTDQEVQNARLSARRRALMGAGMGGTFLSGPLGDSSTPATKTPTLSGY